VTVSPASQSLALASKISHARIWSWDYRSVVFEVNNGEQCGTMWGIVCVILSVPPMGPCAICWDYAKEAICSRDWLKGQEVKSRCKLEADWKLLDWNSKYGRESKMATQSKMADQQLHFRSLEKNGELTNAGNR